MKIERHDWPAISALLDSVLDLPSAQRARWLDDLPAHERVYKDVLISLLANGAQAEAQGFLESLPKLGSSAETDHSGPEGHTREVGPYTLLRELGRGGMGSVWLAERSDGQPRRHLALKLPHPGLTTRAFAERLARERDILALLTHPNIARLYDAGVSAEGQAYIALEYVRGESLIEHCNQKHLGLRARIVLFQQVLDAVQYAHAHLVVHRDLKPSNVMVDEQGQVRLLDFGIAKLLVDGRAENTELTLDTGKALTPNYASPEQLVGAGVTTASDLYSLGVLLYELVAGVRPYDLGRMAQLSTPEHTLFALDVRRPSAAAAGAPTSPLAAIMGASRLQRELRGDIDSIVMMAMRKEAAGRYPSADTFKQDLQRYLDGLPVAARPDRWAHRAGKFIRRHRFSVTAAALVFLALLLGMAGTLWQAQQAQMQAQQAQAVRDFLIGLFEQADPDGPQGRPTTVRELVDRGQADLQTKLADQPRLRQQLDGVLVDLYVSLANFDKAMPLALARRDAARATDGAQSVEYGDALESLAGVRLGAEQFETAIQDYEAARQILRHHRSERADKLLLLDGHLAFAYQASGHLAEAANLLRHLVPDLQSRFGAESWELIANKAVLADVVAQQGDLGQALSIVDEIEPELDRHGASHAVDAATLRNNIASVRRRAHQLDKAERSMRRAQSEFVKLQGPDSADAMTAGFNLAALLQEQGKFADAANAFDELKQQAIRVHGADGPETRRIEARSVMALIMVGRVAEVEAMARESLRQVQQSSGATAAAVRVQVRQLGLSLIFNGKAQEATRLLEADLAEEPGSATEPGSKTRGLTSLYLAGANMGLGRLDAAAELARQAEQIFAERPASDLDIARAQLTRALALARSRQIAAARALIVQAQAQLRHADMPQHPLHLFVELVKSEALEAEGHHADARSLDQSTRERLRESAGVRLPARIPMIL